MIWAPNLAIFCLEINVFPPNPIHKTADPNPLLSTYNYANKTDPILASTNQLIETPLKQYAKQLTKTPVYPISKIMTGTSSLTNTVEPRYLELAYFELPLISKWKSGPCFNMKLWQQVTK